MVALFPLFQQFRQQRHPPKAKNLANWYSWACWGIETRSNTLKVPQVATTNHSAATKNSEKPCAWELQLLDCGILRGDRADKRQPVLRIPPPNFHPDSSQPEPHIPEGVAIGVLAAVIDQADLMAAGQLVQFEVVTYQEAD